MHRKLYRYHAAIVKNYASEDGYEDRYEDGYKDGYEDGYEDESSKIETENRG